MGEYLSVQLRDGVELAWLGLRPPLEPAMFVVKWTENGLSQYCLRLVASQDRGVSIGDSVIKDRLSSIGRLGLADVTDRLANSAGKVLPERWYEPLLSDPRALLIRTAASNVGCAPKT